MLDIKAKPENANLPYLYAVIVLVLLVAAYLLGRFDGQHELATTVQHQSEESTTVSR